jgi:protein-S-isoprenylcysteine O-methyltransferase Ste14
MIGATDRGDRPMIPPSSDERRTKAFNLLKSLLHNLGVAIVGFGFALLGRGLDQLLGLHRIDSASATIAGWCLMAIGFLLRAWATFHFYERRMKVISLVPQQALITSGPYRFSRNPLYLGGNVFMFLGAVLILGSPGGIALTAINIIAMDFMIRREEKQLERDFGERWVAYRSRVRRWL